MKVVVHLTNVVVGGQEIRIIEVPGYATIADLIGELGLYSAQIDERYYRIRDPNFYNVQTLPYIIIDGAVHWEPPYSTVKISDFFATHEIDNGGIYIDCGIPQAGGPGLFDVSTMWRQFYSLLQELEPIVEVGGVIIAAGRYIRAKLQRKSPPKSLEAISPGAVFSLVLSRQQWTAGELAKLVGIAQEDAKQLLKVCQYRWDRQRLMYIQTKATLEVISRLNNASWHDEHP